MHSQLPNIDRYVRKAIPLNMHAQLLNMEKGLRKAFLNMHALSPKRGRCIRKTLFKHACAATK